MKTKFLPLIIFVLTLWLCKKTYAQSVEKYRSNFFAEYGVMQYNANNKTFIDKNQHFLSAGLGYNRNLTDWFSTGLKTKYYRLSTTTSGQPILGANALQLQFGLHLPRVSAAYQLNRIVPHFAFGMGYAIDHYNNDIENYTQKYPFVPLMAGIDYNLSSRFSIGVEGEYRLTEKRYNTHVQNYNSLLNTFNAVSVRLGFHFGTNNKKITNIQKIYTRQNTSNKQEAGKFDLTDTLTIKADVEKTNSVLNNGFKAITDTTLNINKQEFKTITTYKADYLSNHKISELTKFEAVNIDSINSLVDETANQKQSDINKKIYQKLLETNNTVQKENLALKQKLIQLENDYKRKAVNNSAKVLTATPNQQYAENLQTTPILAQQKPKNNLVIIPAVIPSGNSKKSTDTLKKDSGSIVKQSASIDSILAQLSNIEHKLALLTEKTATPSIIVANTSSKAENSKLQEQIIQLQKQNKTLQELLANTKKIEDVADTSNAHVEAELVYFNLNQSQLNTNLKNQLSKYYRDAIKPSKIKWLVLEGFTDRSGNAAYNLTLSKKRVAAVKSFLIDLGVPKKAILEKNFGSKFATEDLNSNERKVKITLVKN